MPSANYLFDSIQTLGKSSATFVSLSTVTIAGANVFGDGDFTSTVTVNGNLYGGYFNSASVCTGLMATWGSTHRMPRAKPTRCRSRPPPITAEP